MADDKDKKIPEVPHLENIKGDEKIPVSADGEPRHILTGQLEKAVDIISASATSLNAEVGKYYRFEDEVNTLEVTLPKISEVSKLSSLVLSFTTGDAPQVTITADKEISYFEGFSIDANTTYELNLMFNGSKWIVAYGVVE